jgi:hypothetical protein
VSLLEHVIKIGIANFVRDNTLLLLSCRLPVYVTDLEMTVAFMKLILSKSEVGIILQVHKQMLQAPLCSYQSTFPRWAKNLNFQYIHSFHIRQI